MNKTTSLIKLENIFRFYFTKRVLLVINLLFLVIYGYLYYQAIQFDKEPAFPINAQENNDALLNKKIVVTGEIHYKPYDPIFYSHLEPRERQKDGFYYITLGTNNNQSITCIFSDSTKTEETIVSLALKGTVTITGKAIYISPDKVIIEQCHFSSFKSDVFNINFWIVLFIMIGLNIVFYKCQTDRERYF